MGWYLSTEHVARRSSEWSVDVNLRSGLIPVIRFKIIYVWPHSQRVAQVRLGVLDLLLCAAAAAPSPQAPS